MFKDFVPMAEIIPPGEVGETKIDHFEVTEHIASITNLRAMCKGHREQTVIPGKYVRLVVRNTLVMSDTQMEHRTNNVLLWACTCAGGPVLIAGLGIGMVLLPTVAIPSVTSVLVIEKNPDVIHLVEAPLRKALAQKEGLNEKLTIVNADIFDWKPPKGQKWNVIYFDIWPEISEDNLSEITTLKRKFAKRLNREHPQAWMGAWAEKIIKRDRDR